MSQFAFDMDKWVKRAKVKADTFVKEFTQDMAREVVEATSVRTGFLRGSWYASLNDPFKFDEGRNDPSGSISVAKMSITINGMTTNGVIYVLNGANYAQHVEYGTTRMEPQAFVRGTLSKANFVAAKTAARIRAL